MSSTPLLDALLQCDQASPPPLSALKILAPNVPEHLLRDARRDQGINAQVAKPAAVPLDIGPLSHLLPYI
jgi:hypothetical protein